MSDSIKASDLAELQFTKDWTNPSDFPTYEPNETQVRADQQFLFNEIKAFINGKLVPAIKSAAQTGGGGGSVTGEVVADVYINADGHLIVKMADGTEDDLGTWIGETKPTIQNTIITNNLYAENGDIANLTVDSLSTSRRVVRYLARDTSDDNYISAQDQYLKFMTGTTDGSTTQHRDRAGRLLYWEQDIDGLTLNDLGYPVDKDGIQVGITAEETDWPVIVYEYTEICKLQWAFSNVPGDDSEQYIPTIILGAGNLSGTSKAFIYKLTDQMRIDYLKTDGTTVSVMFSDLGVKVVGAGDATGLRNVITVPQSAFDASATYGNLGDIVAVVED